MTYGSISYIYVFFLNEGIFFTYGGIDMFDLSVFVFDDCIQLLESPIPSIPAPARHKKRQVAISREPRVVS